MTIHKFEAIYNFSGDRELFATEVKVASNANNEISEGAMLLALLQELSQPELDDLRFVSTCLLYCDSEESYRKLVPWANDADSPLCRGKLYLKNKSTNEQLAQSDHLKSTAAIA